MRHNNAEAETPHAEQKKDETTDSRDPPETTPKEPANRGPQASDAVAAPKASPREEEGAAEEEHTAAPKHEETSQPPAAATAAAAPVAESSRQPPMDLTAICHKSLDGAVSADENDSGDDVLETIYTLNAESNLAMRSNLAAGVEHKMWTQEEMDETIRPAEHVREQVARMVHMFFKEYMRKCVANNSSRKLLMADNAILLNAKRLEEQYSGVKRPYGKDLRLPEVYYQTKRNAQQQCYYTGQEIMQASQNPTADEFSDEVKHNSQARERLFQQLFYIAETPIERTGDTNPKAVAKNKQRMMHRLLNLNPHIMGESVMIAISKSARYWGNISEGSPCRGGRPVLATTIFLGKTFAQMMHDKRWIIMPSQCTHMETLPPCTINLHQFWPPNHERTLPAFAWAFGFRNAQDVDENGKNIFHHLFTSMKFCTYSYDICSRCFKPNEAPLPGDMTKAMRHKVTGGSPRGWTPLHCLCSGSDICLGIREIINTLLSTETVNMRDFDCLQNNDVIVFR